MDETVNWNGANAAAMRSALDLSALLHPAEAFAHPMDVVRDIDLTRNEKRAILASWASDACAVEAMPELRQTPNGRVVRFDDIMEALRLLDREEREGGGRAPLRLALGTRRAAPFPRRARPGPAFRAFRPQP